MATVDMTVGSPSKHLLKFALPLLCGNLFQQFYNMVDSIIVGKFVGSNALASVGACGSLNFLFFSLSSGLALGIGVIVAQYFGAGDDTNVKKTISSSIYVLFFAAVLVSLIGVIFAPYILQFMKTPSEIIGYSTIYLRTTCSGIIFIVAYNGISAILRALGDSKTPLYFLIVSSIVNVVLDLVFVLNLGMGVFGVALATVFSQLVSAVSCFIFAVHKNPYFRLTKAELKPHRKIIFMSVRLGLPIALQNSLIAVSCIVLQSVVNRFGATVVAAFTITGRVEQIVQQGFGSLQMAMSTYAGQNVGAGKIDRVKKGFHRAVVMVAIYSAVMLVVMYTLGRGIARFFVDETEVINIASKALRITSLAYFGLGMIYIPRGLLNGAGDTGFSMINGITEVIGRIGFAVLLTNIAVIGYWGAWMTNGLTWYITGIVCVIRYMSGIWQKKRITQ